MDWGPHVADETSYVKVFWCDNKPGIVKIDSDAKFADVVNELAYDTDQDTLDVEWMFNRLAERLLMNGDAARCGDAVRAFVLEYLPIFVQLSPNATLTEIVADISYATGMYAVDIENAFDDLAKFILEHTNKVVGDD